MAHKFISEDEVRKIITELYRMSIPAGLICELAYLRNMRAGDIRYAKASHFRQLNGYPEFYLWNDKTRTNEYFPIPQGIYDKIQSYIKENGLKPEDHVFKITTSTGNHKGHVGVICRFWLQKLWYKACKAVGIYEETVIDRRLCSKCPHYLGDLKCNVLGHPKRRDFINIKHCVEKGVSRKELEKHPRLHESLRGVGAISKIKHYMTQGFDYEIAKRKVFKFSNWSNWDVYNRYMDSALEREIGTNDYVNDWCNKSLI